MAQEHTRHASWLELFFDLVVVAAVVQLAHRLHGDPGIGDIAVFAALYLAVWLGWASFTLYANVARDATSQRYMMLAMFGIAVMAAAVPQATGARADVFAGAYILVRVFATRTFARTRQMLLAWPSVQMSGGVVPWIVSLFVPAPWKFVLWGLGLAADLLLPAFSGPKRQQEIAERFHRGRVTLSEARLDLPHLAERLGLLVIIVLGEAVMQLVNAAAGVQWDGALIATATAGFALLGLLWAPIFRWGFIAGEGQALEVRLVMPLHFLNTVSITAVAAGLGSLTGHAHGHVPGGVRWLLCGGIAVYFASVVAGAIMMRTPWWRVLVLAFVAVVLPILIGLLSADLPAPVLTWLIVLAVAAQVAFAFWAERRIRNARNTG